MIQWNGTGTLIHIRSISLVSVTGRKTKSGCRKKWWTSGQSARRHFGEEKKDYEEKWKKTGLIMNHSKSARSIARWTSSPSFVLLDSIQRRYRINSRPQTRLPVICRQAALYTVTKLTKDNPTHIIKHDFASSSTIFDWFFCEYVRMRGRILKFFTLAIFKITVTLESIV